MLNFILQQAMFMGSIVRAEIKDRESNARAGKNMCRLCSICTLSNKISFYSSCIKEDGDKMNSYSWLFAPILLNLSSFQCLDPSFNLCLYCPFLNILIPDSLSTFLNSNSVIFLLLNFNGSGLSIRSATYSGFPNWVQIFQHTYYKDFAPPPFFFFLKLWF